MPAPSFPFDPATDTEVLADKPVTQEVGRKLRDDGYAKVPDCIVTQETDPTKVLRPDGSGGAVWTPGGGAVSALSTMFSAGTQASPVSVLTFPANYKYVGNLVVESVDAATGLTLQGKAVIPIILDMSGTPEFTYISPQAGRTVMNAASRTTHVYDLTGSTSFGTVVVIASATGIDATWTGNTEALKFSFSGVSQPT